MAFRELLSVTNYDTLNYYNWTSTTTDCTLHVFQDTLYAWDISVRTKCTDSLYILLFIISYLLLMIMASHLVILCLEFM